MIVLIIILILKIISIVYEKVELMSDRMKYKKLKYFIFPQTYEIPYNKINDLEMTTYISGLSKIKVLT
jgi:hydroxyacyl-ACP dehydratase HTD2-like protein with hotdog domain